MSVSALYVFKKTELVLNTHDLSLSAEKSLYFISSCQTVVWKFIILPNSDSKLKPKTKSFRLCRFKNKRKNVVRNGQSEARLSGTLRRHIKTETNSMCKEMMT